MRRGLLGRLLVAALSILLLIAWPFYSIWTAGFLGVVGVEMKRDWFDQPATEVWQKALVAGYFVFGSVVLGIGRSFLTSRHRAFRARVALHSCLVAAESTGAAVLVAVAGGGEMGAGIAGAGFTMLVTWLLLVRWWLRLPAPASPPVQHVVPSAVRPARGYFRGVQPASGHIWWAEVPYDDQDFADDRPCLVVRTHDHHAEVLKITSQDKSGRPDYAWLPTASWDGKSERTGWLELHPLRVVGYSAFRKPAGLCDIDVWAQVVELHGATNSRT